MKKNFYNDFDELYQDQMDREERPRFTFILKVNYNNKWFICNRNSDYKFLSKKNLIDRLNTEENIILSFWNFSDKLLTFDNLKVDILERLPYENYNKQDQRDINIIKKKYIETLNAGNDLSDNCLNKVLNDYYNNFSFDFYDFNYKFISDVEKIVTGTLLSELVMFINKDKNIKVLIIVHILIMEVYLR